MAVPLPSTLSTSSQQGTVDAMLDSKGDMLPQQDSPSMIHNSQADLEPDRARNDDLSDSQNSGKHLTSPKSFRSEADSSTGVNLALDRNAKTRLVSLQCNSCCKLRRSCKGQPGNSCKRCVKNKIRCSFQGPRPFLCKLCNRDYSTESILKGHITRSHPREIPRPVDLDGPEATCITDSPQTSAQQISKSPLQHLERSKTSTNRISNPSCGETARPPGKAESQRQRWPDGVHPLSHVPELQQQPPLQYPQPEKSMLNHPDLSSEGPQQEIVYQGRGQSLPCGESPVPKTYEGLHFEIFDTYERRNLSPDHIQRTLDGIRDDIDQYSEFMRGKDRETSIEVRERLGFLDEVRPLIHLQEIDAETSEIYGKQDSRLVILLRSMFTVKDNSRLEEGLEILGLEVRLLKLPHLVCGVLAYYLLQLFTERDVIREAELKATELTHGPIEAANTIQHSRLMAQECYFFQARLENRAKKLATSLYDLIRPLTHWQQAILHNGSVEQHIERLRKMIFASLCLAAELEARKGTFSFFWPRSGEQFDPKIHNDEADDPTPERNKNMGRGRKKLIACTLMPGVVRMMENKELVYAKATVIAI